MTNPPIGPIRPFLEGAEATSWFTQLLGGGSVLDTHQTVVSEVFGPSVPIQLRAAVDPSSGTPTVLILDILGSPDDDEAWRKFLEVQERLLEIQENLSSRLGMSTPYGRIVVSFGAPPADWERLVQGLANHE